MAMARYKETVQVGDKVELMPRSVIDAFAIAKAFLKVPHDLSLLHRGVSGQQSIVETGQDLGQGIVKVYKGLVAKTRQTLINRRGGFQHALDLVENVAHVFYRLLWRCQCTCSQCIKGQNETVETVQEASLGVLMTEALRSSTKDTNAEYVSDP